MGEQDFGGEKKQAFEKGSTCGACRQKDPVGDRANNAGSGPGPAESLTTKVDVRMGWC